MGNGGLLPPGLVGCGGCALPRRCVDRAGGRRRPPDVPLRTAVERSGVPRADLGRPQVPPRARPVVRPVRGRLLRGPVLGRVDARRHRVAYRRHPGQRFHRYVRVHRCRGLYGAGAEGARGSSLVAGQAAPGVRGRVGGRGVGRGSGGGCQGERGRSRRRRGRGIRGCRRRSRGRCRCRCRGRGRGNW